MSLLRSSALYADIAMVSKSMTLFAARIAIPESKPKNRFNAKTAVKPMRKPTSLKISAVSNLVLSLIV